MRVSRKKYLFSDLIDLSSFSSIDLSLSRTLLPISSTMTSETGFFLIASCKNKKKGVHSKSDSKKPVFHVFVHTKKNWTASMKNVEWNSLGLFERFRARLSRVWEKKCDGLLKLNFYKTKIANSFDNRNFH